MRRSVRRAGLFAVVCGVVAAGLSYGQTHDPRRALIAGGIGLALGFLLMLALRSRPDG